MEVKVMVVVEVTVNDAIGVSVAVGVMVGVLVGVDPAYAERFMGSLKRECLDNFIILNRCHLNGVVKEYAVYFNGHRPHQGLNRQIPERSDKKPRS